MPLTHLLISISATPVVYNLALGNLSVSNLYSSSKTPRNFFTAIGLFNFNVGVSNSFSIVNGSIINLKLFTRS